MKYLVKDTPIRKNKKTYGVGEIFPYSAKDEKLLWNLTELKEEKQSSKEVSKDGTTKNVEPKAVEKKTATAIKKAATKRKTNSKKK